MIGLLILFSVAAALLICGGTAALLYQLYHPRRKTLGFALAHHLPPDPAALGLTFVERMFKLSDGAASLGWVITCGASPKGHDSGCHWPDAKPSKGAAADQCGHVRDARAVVVISHGWSASRYEVLDRLGPLPDLAAQIVIYDLRGHGDSTARTSRLGTTEVDDLLAILDQLDASDSPIVLMGCGLGAAISIAAAAKATPVDQGRRQAVTGRGRVAGVIAIGACRFHTMPIAALLRHMDVPRQPFAWLIAAHLGFWLARARSFDRAAHAARLECPLLLLQAADDPTAPIEEARQIARAAPHAELVEFPGAASTEVARVDPARYLGALQGFFHGLSMPESGPEHGQKPS